MRCRPKHCVNTVGTAYSHSKPFRNRFSCAAANTQGFSKVAVFSVGFVCCPIRLRSTRTAQKRMRGSDLYGQAIEDVVNDTAFKSVRDHQPPQPIVSVLILQMEITPCVIGWRGNSRPLHGLSPDIKLIRLCMVAPNRPASLNRGAGCQQRVSDLLRHMLDSHSTGCKIGIGNWVEGVICVSRHLFLQD
jgi:hypothetical protein